MSEQQPQSADAAVELNNELKARREKLSVLRANGVAFPNDFRRDSLSNQLHESYGEKSNEELEDLGIEVVAVGTAVVLACATDAAAAVEHGGIGEEDGGGVVCAGNGHWVHLCPDAGAGVV